MKPSAFLERRAAAEFVRAVKASGLSSRLLAKAAGEFWPEVGRLWIRGTQVELTLTQAARALSRAAAAAQECADAIAGGRAENELANLAERSLERAERGRTRG